MDLCQRWIISTKYDESECVMLVEERVKKTVIIYDSKFACVFKCWMCITLDF